MEIVYLYIHDYRKFKKQNINFGSEYIFHYDEKSDLLISEKNSLYLNNFYSHEGNTNILNISAIIGENGTGKTSIIEYLIVNCLYDSSKMNDNDILVIKNNSEFYLITFRDINYNEDIYKRIQLKRNGNSDSLFSKFSYQTIFLSNIFNGTSNLPESLPIFNISTDFLVNRSTGDSFFVDKLSLFKNDEIKRQLRFLLDERNKKYFIFEFNKEVEIFIRDSELSGFNGNVGNAKLSVFLQNLEKRLDFKKSEDCDFEYIKIIFLMSLFSKQILSLIGEKQVSLIDKDNNSKNASEKKILEIETLLDQLGKDLNVLLDEVQIISVKELKSMKETLFSKYEELVEILLTSSSFPIFYSENTFSKDLDLAKYISNELGGVSVDAYNKKISINFRTFKKFDELTIDSYTLKDHFRYDYKSISSGQRAFLNIFSRLHDLVQNVKGDKNKLNSKKTIILFIDEGDLYLHPKWQKELINHLIKFLNDIYSRYRIQLIFTSNNPLPVSDLLSYNTVFLKNNCNDLQTIIQDSLEDQKHTFAANIHTLLADSFFVKGGLIGDFSKDKINEVITLLSKGKELSQEEHSYIKKLIKQIGEPLIKNKLLQMYTQNNGLDFLQRLEYLESKLKSND